MKSTTNNFSKNFLKIVVTFSIIFFFLYLLFPFILAILMGAILAFALSSTLNYIQSKGLTKQAALSLLTAVIFLILLAPTLAFFIRGAKILTRAINNPENSVKLYQLLGQLSSYIEKVSPSVGISPDEVQEYMQQATQKLSTFTLSIFSKFISEVPHLALFSVILIVSAYFFLSYEDSIRKLFDRFFNFTPGNGRKFISVLQLSSREIFLSNVLTGFIQASVITLGAAIFQFNEWFLIFFITFIASFIPVIGAGPIALLLSISAFASTNYTPAIGMLVVSIIAGTSDNIIRPYLASRGNINVPGVISFLSVIGGVITMGLPGLFLGPLTASLTFGVLPILLDEFLPNGENG